jgi:hypothetical protein
MPRYFYSQLAQRPLVANGISFEFHKTGILGGNICGVYATQSPQEEEALALAVSQRLGVEEISAADYEQQMAQKKTTLTSSPYLTLRPVHQAAQGPSLSMAEDKQGVQSAENAAPKSSDKPKDVVPASEMDSLKATEPVSSPDVLIQDQNRLEPVKSKGKGRGRN